MKNNKGKIETGIIAQTNKKRCVNIWMRKRTRENQTGSQMQRHSEERERQRKKGLERNKDGERVSKKSEK